LPAGQSASENAPKIFMTETPVKKFHLKLRQFLKRLFVRMARSLSNDEGRQNISKHSSRITER
jgi:hypothetical protein